MEARSVILRCQGMQIGAYAVPPFDLHSAELIQIRFPSCAFVELKQLRQSLCLASGEGPNRSRVKVVADDFPYHRPWWREIFHNLRADEWLRQRTGVPVSESRRLLKVVGMDPDTPICEMAGTPLKLLAIQAAFAVHCDVLIFDLNGLDPMGMRRALAAVFTQLGKSAAICLALGHDRHDPHIEYSVTIELRSSNTHTGLGRHFVSTSPAA